jgi:enamine deaminase RidA (YjgF/YER057c/UK114 family)
VFGQIRPAATLVEVSGLLDPWMKVEIEVYAIEPKRRRFLWLSRSA